MTKKKKDETINMIPEFRNAQYLNAKKTKVACEIRLYGSNEWLPWSHDLTDGDDAYTTVAFETLLNNGEIEISEATPEDLEIARMDAENEAICFVKEERARLLAQTDHYMMPDYDISDEKREAMREYRQALRDITKQDGYPYNVIFPKYPFRE